MKNAGTLENPSEYSLLERAEDIVYITDSQGRLTWMNRNARGLNRGKAEALLGGPLDPLILEEDLPKVKQSLERALKGQPQHCDARVTGKKGDVLLLSINTTPIYREGKVDGTLNIARDVTEVKRLQERLRESEEKYRTLVDKSPDGIYVFQDDMFKLCNRKFIEESGYTLEELKTKKFWELVHPEDRGLVRRKGQARESGKAVPGHYEFRGVRKDGSVIYLELWATAIKYEGRPAAMGILRNITERKRLQEEILRGHRQLEEFGKIANIILQERDLRRILEAIARAVKEYSGFNRVAIITLDEGFQVKEVAFAGLSEAEIEAWKGGKKISPEERRQIFQSQFRISDSYYIPHDQVPWERDRGIPSKVSPKETDDWHPRDYLYIPLYGREGIVVGLISVDDPVDGRAPTEAKLKPIEIFASLAATAIENARMYQELRTRLDELERWHRVTVDRELKMIELKNRIKGLEKRLNGSRNKV